MSPTAMPARAWRGMDGEKRRDDFRYWPKCEVPTVLGNVRFQGQSRRHVLTLSSSDFDPSETSLGAVAELDLPPCSIAR
jgi:hypothetical protein